MPRFIRFCALVTLVTGALLGGSLSLAAPAGASPNLTAGTNVVGSCVTAPAPGSNFTGSDPISAAVAATSPGGTVYICPGTFVDNVHVTADNVTIEGAGQGQTIVESAISDPTCATEDANDNCDATVFLVSGDNVTISGLTINGDTPGGSQEVPCDGDLSTNDPGWCSGVQFDAFAGIANDVDGNTYPAITGLSVQDVTIENVYEQPVYIQSVGGSFSLTDSTITDVGSEYGQGVFDYDASGTIAGNTISNASWGIYENTIGGTNALSISGNTLSDDNEAIWASNDHAATTISGNTISGCWGPAGPFPNSESAGTGYSWATWPSLTGPAQNALGIGVFAPFVAGTVSDNTITGCATGLATFGSNGSSPGPVLTVSGNTINGDNTSGSIGALLTTGEDGFGCNPADVNLTGNTFENNSTSIYTDETPLGMDAADDWNPYGGAYGTYYSCALPGGLTLTASGNDFSGNWFNDATGSITATDNWWGSAAGPSPMIGSPDGETSQQLISRAAPTWWTTSNEKPSAPQGVSATRGNGAVAVSWSAPEYTGSTDPSVTVTGYTVTASPGGSTCTTSSLGCSVTGLTNGQSYTFTVTAANSIGTGAASSPATATPATVPGAPTGPNAQAGNGAATVSWTAPASNGSAITSYTVTASPSGRTCTTSSLSCTVTGLVNDTGYTFTVAATNGVGAGPSSTASSERIPTGPVTISPFSKGSSVVTSSMKSQISALASLIKIDGFTDVSIAGYVNPNESSLSSGELGSQRAYNAAVALASALRNIGVRGVKFVGSYGGPKYVAPIGAAANRRVVATLS